MKIIFSILKSYLWILWLALGVLIIGLITDQHSKGTANIFVLLSGLLFFVFAIFHKRLGLNYIGGQVNYKGKKAVSSASLFIIAIIIFGSIALRGTTFSFSNIITSVLYAIPYSYILYKTEVLAVDEYNK